MVGFIPGKPVAVLCSLFSVICSLCVWVLTMSEYHDVFA